MMIVRLLLVFAAGLLVLKLFFGALPGIIQLVMKLNQDQVWALVFLMLFCIGGGVIVFGILIDRIFRGR